MTKSRTFDSAKDVIDLSHIDANLTAAGLQSFTFIGTAPFSGSGAQVRYQQDPTRDMTYVEADLSGNSSPDLYMELYGLQTLSAANFALTPAQSSADLAAGGQLGISTTRVGSGSEFFYSNVKGRSYSSFEDLYTNSTNRIASDLNLSSSANELDLGRGQQTNTPMKITRASGTETVSASSINFSLAYHSDRNHPGRQRGRRHFCSPYGIRRRNCQRLRRLGRPSRHHPARDRLLLVPDPRHDTGSGPGGGALAFQQQQRRNDDPRLLRRQPRRWPD